MLAKLHRFHGYNSLRSVYKNAQTVRAPQLTLKYSHRSNGRPCRVAVVVSRKVSKSAVVRNRIRRRIYELVRAQASTLQGYDLVFTVFHEQLADIDAAKLASLIDQLLRKTHKQQ